MSDDAIERLTAERDEARAEVERLRREASSADATRERMAALLTGVANALRGPPPELVWWSWHDLPQRAAAVREDFEQLRDFADRVRLERDHAAEVETPTAIADARDQARRAALEEAIGAVQATDPERCEGAIAHALAALRALLDTPRADPVSAEPPCTCLHDAGWGSPRRSCERHP